jgi:acyl-CoA reductase-like NAD-dependent aldehyde dehydrogenase
MITVLHNIYIIPAPAPAPAPVYTQVSSISEIVSAAHAAFDSGMTQDVKWRIHQLKQLRLALQENEQAFCAAHNADLGQTGFFTKLAETGATIKEINYALDHVRRDHQCCNAAMLQCNVILTV